MKSNLLERLIEESLSYDYFDSSINQYIPYYVEWRLLPFSVIVCPVAGEVLFELQTGETRTVKPGETLIIPSNIRHKFGMIDGLVHHTHLQFNVFDHIDLLSLYTVPYLLQGPESTQICQLVQRQHRAFLHKKDVKVNLKEIVKAKAVTFELLSYILDISKLNVESLHFINHFLKISPVIKYMNDHLNESISREDMARIISLSPTRFHYVFTEIMKTSPVAYLKLLRLEKARRLLMSTDLTVAEIAEEVGFKDVSHFSKQFKAAYGLSPLKNKEIKCIYRPSRPSANTCRKKIRTKWQWKQKRRLIPFFPVCDHKPPIQELHQIFEAVKAAVIGHSCKIRIPPSYCRQGFLLFLICLISYEACFCHRNSECQGLHSLDNSG